MALLARQEDRLRRIGFTEYEISAFQRNLMERPQTVDLSTGTWMAVIDKRKKWLAKWVKRGGSKFTFDHMIADYYSKNAMASPWDWVKLEYRPPTKLKDFQAAAKKRAQKFYKASQGRLNQPFQSRFIEKVQPRRGR